MPGLLRDAVRDARFRCLGVRVMPQIKVCDRKVSVLLRAAFGAGLAAAVLCANVTESSPPEQTTSVRKAVCSLF